MGATMENKKVEFKKSDIYTGEDFEQDVKVLFGELKISMYYDKDNLEIYYANNSEVKILSIHFGILDFRNIGSELGLKIYHLWKKIEKVG